MGNYIIFITSKIQLLKTPPNFYELLWKNYEKILIKSNKIQEKNMMILYISLLNYINSKIL